MKAKISLRLFLLVFISLLAIILGWYYGSIFFNTNSYKTNFVFRYQNGIVHVNLKKSTNSKFDLIAEYTDSNNLKKTNKWPLNYPVFRLDVGDIDNDNSPNIMVGVIKRTRFDTVLRKRLFIFKLVNGYIRPAWLGSRVSQPLIDFKFYSIHKQNVIRTIELERSGKFLIAEYCWNHFGLIFIHYLAREKSYFQSYRILNNKNYETNN
jgi:hypothetical protein